MAALAEAIIAAFDPNAKIIWTTAGVGTAIATFTHDGLLVTTTFANVGGAEWQVGFVVAPDANSTNAAVHASVRIFGGVFQAVREFLEVRQPMRLVFASKNEALGSLYEAYLEWQDSELRQLGYRLATTRVEPLVEYALEKSTPSSWRD